MDKALIELIYARFLKSTGVSTDTRKLEPGELFFGLVGPNFDGGAYAETALASGAAYAVVQDERYLTDNRIILVPDALQALQALAQFHRQNFRGQVLAITGSNGKTTTKELVNRVLSAKYITHATLGNLNNHIGVPLTILQLYPQIEVAIVEMGANRVGDIKELCNYASPNMGLITNIGKAHTETFGGIDGVLRGKSELFDFLRQTHGHVFLNTSDGRLAPMLNRFLSVSRYPQDDVTYSSEGPYLSLHLAGATYPTTISGSYNFQNIAAAVAIGRHFGVNDADIGAAISNYQPGNYRSEIFEKDMLTIFMDAYNANPTSMEAALDHMAHLTTQPKTVILGDMNELENSDREHLAIASKIKALPIDRVLLVGIKVQVMKKVLPDASLHEDTDAVIKCLKQDPLTEGIVLLKASRSVQLEKVYEYLRTFV